MSDLKYRKQDAEETTIPSGTNAMPSSNQSDFDGYHKWLGIPKSKSRSYYDILAIALDEEDHDVIRAAVEQRRHFVESKRGEGHDDDVAEILYQINEAEVTLLNEELRHEYDRRMALFERRQKNRQVDPMAASTRLKSRPGRVVGEDNGFVATFAGLVGVICVAFAMVAWFSFRLPWSKPEQQPDPAPVAVEQPVVPIPQHVAQELVVPQHQPVDIPDVTIRPVKEPSLPKAPATVDESMTLEELAQVPTPQANVWTVELDSSGKQLLSCGDRSLMLWDFRAGFENVSPTILCMNNQSVGTIASASFLDNTDRVVTSHGNGEMRLWDTRQRPPKVGKVFKKFPNPWPKLTVSPDGSKLLAWDGKLGEAVLWKNDNGKLIHLADMSFESRIVSASFSPDSKTLAVGREGAGTTTLWDCTVRHPKNVRTLAYAGSNSSGSGVCFSSDGRKLAVIVGTSIQVFALEGESDGPVVLNDATHGFTKLMFSKDCSHIFSASHAHPTIGMQNAICIWSLNWKQKTQTIEKEGGMNDSLSLSRDGTVLVSGGELPGRGGLIRVWRVVHEEPDQ